MCGLAGFINPSAAPCEELAAVADAMSATLCHRGPDDEGLWIDQNAGVALAFRRLSILDLSEAGHQPAFSADGRYVLTFNGEIYNHLALRAQLERETGPRKWRGHADSETLLESFAAWGVRKTLEATVGMFAIALWDRVDRRLYLARDRFGEKPLYYGWTRGAFAFGSEIKALRRYPGFDNPIDRDALALYLQYSAVPAPYSIYKHIYKLEPGCLLSLSPREAARPVSSALFAPAANGGLRVERYWSLDDVVERGLANPLTDEREATDRVEAALSEAVRLQSIADVPLGAFLSGGIDSSTIVALMQAQSPGRVKTYTIGFEESGFNEAEHAKAVATHLRTDHTELYVTAEQARDVIPTLPDLYSEPFADSSQIPTHLVARMARRYVTVALSGDGGDELFGGYSRYLWGRLVWSRLAWLPHSARRAVAGAIQFVPIPWWNMAGGHLPGAPRVAQLGHKAHKVAARFGNVQDLDDFYRTLASTWPGGGSVVIGAQPLRTTLDQRRRGLANAEPEHRMMRWDALTYLPDDILHKVDRAAMGVSLETRVPFLDHRVSELAWRLPLDMKIRDGKSKWIVRQVLYRHVPEHLVERPKMGFALPMDLWLRAPLREWAENLISESKLRREGYFDPAPIREKWREHLSGKRDWQHELWSVLMFQAWLA